MAGTYRLRRTYEAMDTKNSTPAGHEPLDGRDRLILALYAQLKAERQTREAMERAIRSGSVSLDVLEAMASDPVPVVTDSDIAALEILLEADEARRRGQEEG